MKVKKEIEQNDDIKLGNKKKKRRCRDEMEGQQEKIEIEEKENK